MARSGNRRGYAKRRKTGMKLMFAKSSTLNKRQLRKKKMMINITTGMLLVLVELIALGIFLAALFRLNIIPAKYMAILIGVLLVITLYNILSQFTKAHWFGKVLSVLLAVVMFTASAYAGKASSVLGKISGVTVKTDVFSLVVLKEDPAASAADTAKYTFGYNDKNEKEMAEELLSEVGSITGAEVATRTYDNGTEAVNALYNKEVQVIVFNEATRSMIQEHFTDFSDRTKVIYEKKFTTHIKSDVVDKNTGMDTFTVYVSGNDQEGKLLSSGLSDVNIIVTFNPKTRQVLMVSTPRDYFIPVYTLKKDANGKDITGYDKLTHAGNYGIDGSIVTLENLYGIDIDYYIKLNFTGAVGVVDALGGITIDSAVEFTNGNDAAPIAYHFNIGPNECDGEKALAFCRERQAFKAEGDKQRGRNQMAAIKAIINKATSPAILTQYNQVLDAALEVIATNMPESAITDLVRAQLNDTKSWNIMSYSVSGDGGQTRTGELFGLRNMSVLIPDYNTVNIAIELMSKVSNGEIFDIDRFLEEKEMQSQMPTAG